MREHTAFYPFQPHQKKVWNTLHWSKINGTWSYIFLSMCHHILFTAQPGEPLILTLIYANKSCIHQEPLRVVADRPLNYTFTCDFGYTFATQRSTKVCGNFTVCLSSYIAYIAPVSCPQLLDHVTEFYPSVLTPLAISNTPRQSQCHLRTSACGMYWSHKFKDWKTGRAQSPAVRQHYFSEEQSQKSSQTYLQISATWKA